MKKHFKGLFIRLIIPIGCLAFGFYVGKEQGYEKGVMNGWAATVQASSLVELSKGLEKNATSLQEPLGKALCEGLRKGMGEVRETCLTVEGANTLAMSGDPAENILGRTCVLVAPTFNRVCG